MQFIQGINRHQTYFTTPNEQVAADNPVRLMDAFVEKLDLEKLGFRSTSHKKEGRPPFALGVLLKLYLYVYLNKIRSSRKLQKVCPRKTNFEGWPTRQDDGIAGRLHCGYSWVQKYLCPSQSSELYFATVPVAKQEHSLLLKYLGREGHQKIIYCQNNLGLYNNPNCTGWDTYCPTLINHPISCSRKIHFHSLVPHYSPNPQQSQSGNSVYHQRHRRSFNIAFIVRASHATKA